MAKQIVELGSGAFLKGDDHKAEVERNKSIRIFGSRGGKTFDKTFNIGDSAEYDSYNLSYIGTIVGITDKTVTIQERYGREARKHRLKLYTFLWRNYDFDLAVKEEENSRTRMYI